MLDHTCWSCWSHAGEVLFAAELAHVPETTLNGDENQIPYINRTTSFNAKFYAITKIAQVIKVLNLSHRCSLITTALLSDLYSQGMTTSSLVKNELELQHFEGQHCLVAISRHRLSFSYYTPDRKDTLGTWIRLTNSRSDQELLLIHLRTTSKTITAYMNRSETKLPTP